MRLWLMRRRGGRPVVLLLVGYVLLDGLLSIRDSNAAVGDSTMARARRPAGRPVPPSTASPDQPPATTPPARRPAQVVERAVRFALAQRGKPYRRGAEGPGAFDCSGLTWAAYRAAGIDLPRTAAAQYRAGPRVRGRLVRGDLVFFRSRGPSSWHVGLNLGGGRMTEAPGRHARVRVASIRRPGCLGATRPIAGGG